jgi:hypothetical protein
LAQNFFCRCEGGALAVGGHNRKNNAASKENAGPWVFDLIDIDYQSHCKNIKPDIIYVKMASCLKISISGSL